MRPLMYGGFDIVTTSRKHGKTKPQLFVHCGYFDHHDLQSLNDYIFLFFLFYECNFKILGACNTLLERYLQDISSGILKAPKFLKLQLVNPQKKNCSHLASADHGAQKNCNEQTTAVLLYHVSY